MTYPTYESREVAPAVLAFPDLTERWKRAAEHNMIKAVGMGRYSVVLDEELACALKAKCPELTPYNYDEYKDCVQYGPCLESGS